MGAVRVLHKKERLSAVTRSCNSAPFSLAVVGTGIHGIHLASSVVEAGILPEREILLIDPHEEPLFLWNRRVRNCCMDYLRSPASHGLDPQFPALRRRMTDPSDWTEPYHRPSVSLFEKHSKERVHTFLRGTGRVTGIAVAVRRDGTEGSAFRIIVDRHGREEYFARAVILAPGMPPPMVPPFLQVFSVRHVHDPLFDPNTVRPDEKVLIAGGGIAALHLVLSLSSRGSNVTLWNRDPMTVHQFDSDPCFIGPRCASQVSSIKDPTERLQFIRANRRPGSVPADLYRRFTTGLRQHRYTMECVEAVEAHPKGGKILMTGHSHDCSTANQEPVCAIFDRVIIATGFRDEPPAQELVRRIARDLSAPVTPEGYPETERDLSWVPGLYLSGGLADLELGPPARNIIGAHLARRRILPALAAFLNR